MYSPHYERISDELAERMDYEARTGTYLDFSFQNELSTRRAAIAKDEPTILRPSYWKDIDKILYCPFYNRLSDKTQVFALYRNDDLTRRQLHVQLVSKIARTIGRALHLNLDLIEAIAIGHDIGHPPFAHTGERYLDELYCAHTGRHFSHNIHSVRVLDEIFKYNLSLETLVGIACHNGELVHHEYHPVTLDSFATFDEIIESCYLDRKNIERLVPSTLEGCVVRVADIIAYIGKDRQDADRSGFLGESEFPDLPIGRINAEMVNNLTVNIIENSYGKPFLQFDDTHYQCLQSALTENYKMLYKPATAEARLFETARPMMKQMYELLLKDLTENNLRSPIFRHHIDYINAAHYSRDKSYETNEPNQIVVDYIASMTDDYFVDLYAFLFPDSQLHVDYKDYFEDL